jgi:hypothetical protein
MLGGFKLLLDSVRLFTDADERRLPALLKKRQRRQRRGCSTTCGDADATSSATF